MGIDIRDGQQLECITCALCIDACDEVMDRIGRPRGLIGYMALKDEVDERAGARPKNVWTHIFRPRTVLYTALWSAIGLGMLVALFLRSPIGVDVTPVRNPLNVTLADGSIRNTYEVRLRNKHGETLPFTISLQSDGPLELTLEGNDRTVVDVPADETRMQRVYGTAPAGSPAAVTARTEIGLIVEDRANGQSVTRGTVFHGKAD
jgi:polyferredoxin